MVQFGSKDKILVIVFFISVIFLLILCYESSPIRYGGGEARTPGGPRLDVVRYKYKNSKIELKNIFMETLSHNCKSNVGMNFEYLNNCDIYVHGYIDSIYVECWIELEGLPAYDDSACVRNISDVKYVYGANGAATIVNIPQNSWMYGSLKPGNIIHEIKINNMYISFENIINMNKIPKNSFLEINYSDNGQQKIVGRLSF